MRPRQLRWKRLLLLLVVLALVAICLVPWWIGDTSAFGMRVAARLGHWTGGKVRLTGPIQIRYFPDISIRSGLEVTGGRLPMLRSITCHNAKISLNLGELLLGHLSIESVKLFRPEIDVAPSSGMPRDGAGNAMLDVLRMMQAGPLDLIQVNEGKIRFGSGKHARTIEHVTMEIDAGRNADELASNGSFDWRGKTVSFSLATGLDADALDRPVSGATVPVALSITSALLTANIDGQAKLEPAFELDGQMQATVTDLRQSLSWIGIDGLEGAGLKNVAATGPFHLGGGALTFDQGRFSIDGNRATGLLAISLGEKRPRVEATLAFDALDLDPYKPAMVAAKPATPPHAIPTPTADPFLDWPLVKRFDFDLRLSATSVSIDNRELGGGAFTLTANAGMLSGEIGEVALCGGSASGQFSLDLTKPERQADLSGSLEGVDIASCLKLLGVPQRLTGLGTVKATLSAQGRDRSAFLQGLSGTIDVAAKNGTVPIDLSSLAAAHPGIRREGWSSSGDTGFSTLNAGCQLGESHAWCQKFTMETAQARVEGAGDVDIDAQSLDWSLEMTKPSLADSGGGGKTVSPVRLAIKGPLARPLISRMPGEHLDGANVSGAPAGAAPPNE